MAKTINENLIDDVENGDIQNYQPLTAQDIQEQMRLYMERLTTNSVRVAGVIRALNVSKPKQKFDKQTNEPLLDEGGNPIFWDSYYYATIAFEGGELDVQILVDWYDNLKLGSRVLFEGVKGIKFGKVHDIFHTYTVLV